MPEKFDEMLILRKQPQVSDAQLVLAFSGWMDGGEVSTGTVTRLVDMVEAEPVADIDPEEFYIYNFPGSMEVTAMFRPHIEIEDGLVKSFEWPTNTFYCHQEQNLLFFVGKEPNLRWRTFGDCVFRFAEMANVKRIIFVGSFGGLIPHTREPRLHVTCSDDALLPEMEQYGLRRSPYEGPGSFTSYLMTRAPAVGIEMVSLVAEIPGYLQGPNPLSIEAVSRRLAKILQLPVDLDALRSASTEWELQVSSAVEENEELAEQVRQLEDEYDNDLLDQDTE